MIHPSVKPEPTLTGGVLFALGITILVHLGIGLGIVYADATVAPVHTTTAQEKPRRRFGGVAYERRGIELDCNSIPECEPNVESIVVELQVAKLGMKEPDPKKLPELQTYEQPEYVETGVNIKVKMVKVKPLPFQEFKARKARMDKRRRRRRDPFNKLRIFEEDPRKRPTRFEKITGRLDGNPYGRGVDQEKFDSYFARVAYALYNQFEVSTSLAKDVIKKQLVRVKFTGITATGAIVAYRIKRRARKKVFTLNAEACLKQFMPTEGGKATLPVPDAELLKFINKKGFIVDLDGRLLQ